MERWHPKAVDPYGSQDDEAWRATNEAGRDLFALQYAARDLATLLALRGAAASEQERRLFNRFIIADVHAIDLRLQAFCKHTKTVKSEEALMAHKVAWKAFRASVHALEPDFTGARNKVGAHRDSSSTPEDVRHYLTLADSDEFTAMLGKLGVLLDAIWKLPVGEFRAVKKGADGAGIMVAIMKPLRMLPAAPPQQKDTVPGPGGDERG